MADPRFYENCGPFSFSAVCEAAGAKLPDGADGAAFVFDLASLSGAGPRHLSFFAGGGRAASGQFATTAAGFCIVPLGAETPATCIAIACASVPHSFAAVGRLFYPHSSLAPWSQTESIHHSAKIAASASIAPGVVIGPDAEIGHGTRIGPNVVIGRGVAIGSNCAIGGNVTITHAYLGDSVIVLSGAQIGGPGFGFASSPKGHIKIPQLGRVIIQNGVEIGANTTVDRGALGDTVIGEGTKIDNLVQIGHNTRTGRHCVIVSQVGISGSCDLGDFVVLGGQVGVADHVRIGDGARLAARTGVTNNLEGGADYGGIPAKPVKQWARELAAVSMLVKHSKKKS